MIPFSFVNNPITLPPINGTTWSSASHSHGNMRSLAYGKGLFVTTVVRTTSTSPCIYSSPDGITWTGRMNGSGASGTNSFISAAFGNGKFVVVGSDTNGDSPTYYSDDGISWLETGYNPSTRLYQKANAVTFANGRFVTSNGSWSENGSDWNFPSQVNIEFTTSDVAFGNGTWIITSNATGSVNRVYSTDNAQTWIASSTGSGTGFSAIAFGNGVFVTSRTYAAGNSTPIMYWSATGIGNDWTPATTDVTNNAWRDITFDNGVFLAIGIDGVAKSTDGKNWTLTSNTIGRVDTLTHVKYSPDKRLYVGIGNGWSGSSNT